MTDFEIPVDIHKSFKTFVNDPTLFALPITVTNNHLQAHPPFAHQNEPFKTSLSHLTPTINPKTALYLLLRRAQSLIAITYVPYLSPSADRTYLLAHRYDLLKQLGEDHFTQALICKELVEITDVRSWEERDLAEAEAKDVSSADSGVKDLGHRRNKCRLCDRRMQNPISDAAMEALRTLDARGRVVQIIVDPSLTLSLNTTTTLPNLAALTQLIPPEHPTLTFLTHPTTATVYLIYHSPDGADVKARMRHTMAIPGLLVYAEDAGVEVRGKVEVHEVGEVVGAMEEEGMRAVGKYRSVFDRGGFVGTELVYGRMEEERGVVDARG